jgi:metal-responsive CopG/Arc/MetJ family transcriptional regulator
VRAYLSIPDDLVAEADEMAKELNLTRSQLYCQALEAYLAKHEQDDTLPVPRRRSGKGGTK